MSLQAVKSHSRLSLSTQTKVSLRPRGILRVKAAGKVVREYREDDNTIVDARSKSQPASGDLYVQNVQAPVQKRMSKEQRSKLMEEYVGLGGSETKMMAGFGGRVVGALAVMEREEVEVTTSTSSSTSTEVPLRSSKWEINANELLTSTWEHRTWTYGCVGMLAGTMGMGLARVDTAEEAMAAAATLLVSYVLSDLGTGVYHWGVDNYGGPETPFFGRQIAAFQGHHQKPWTITMREFCNNVHQVFKPATPFAFTLLALSPLAPTWWDLWASSFLFLVCMSQQFHAWSHMKKSELHPAVLALQEAGVLISRKAHGAHHRAPFEGNYCIVSGLWNPLLDNSLFFRKLEDLVYAQSGVEPRCWHEPQQGWEELERPGTAV